MGNSKSYALYKHDSGLLKTCIVLETYNERSRIRTIDGTETTVHRSELLPFELCPGAMALCLDSETGAYIPTSVHEVRAAGIAAENRNREICWYAPNEVYLDTVIAGARVGRFTNGQWEEAGTIARVTPRTIWIRDPQGTCFLWRDDERGKQIGIHPEEVAPGAPNTPSSSFGAEQVKASAKMIGLFFGASVLVLLLGIRWYISLVLAGAAFAGIYYVGKGLINTIRFERRGGFAAAVSIISILLLIPTAILLRDGFAVITGIILCSLLVFITVGAIAPEEPKKFVPTSREENTTIAAACAKWLGTDRFYERGEICQFRIPQQKHMSIGRVMGYRGENAIVKHREKQYEVPKRHVQPFLLMAGQRLSVNVNGHIRPGVLLEFLKNNYVIRQDYENSPSFDPIDFSAVDLESLCLPFNMHLLDMPLGQLEDVLRLTDEAMARANEACSEGRIAEAHDILNGALYRCPYVHLLHLGKAMTYQLEGDHSKVLAHAKEVLQAYEGISDQAEIYVIMTNSFWALGREVDALHAALSALNIDPLEKGHWSNVVNALARMGKERESQAFARGSELIALP